jgi:hypothetical protein
LSFSSQLKPADRRSSPGVSLDAVRFDKAAFFVRRATFGRPGSYPRADINSLGGTHVSDAFGSRSASAPYGTGGDERRSDYGRGSSFGGTSAGGSSAGSSFGGSSFESGSRSRSSAGIQQDAEATRSGIGDTINELKDRFNPETAIQYGSDYIRGPGGQRLLGAARENPMAAALTLAGIGWLLYTANRSSSTRRSGSTSSGQGENRSRYSGASSENSRPGVMGDGSQEQNLNQSGQAGSRITRDEVEDAFGSGSNLDTSIR